MSRKVFVGRKVASPINTGALLVGETVVALSADERQLEGGVQLAAGAANEGTVYVGVRANLTAGSNGPTDGFPLAAGESIFLPAAKESDVKFIATQASQRISFVSY